MVQKEVADKLLAAPSTPAYSLTSVRCQYRTIPQLVQVVPAECFTPPPKVDSAFVRMDMRAQPPAPVADEALLWRMVKAGFGMRRKTAHQRAQGRGGGRSRARRTERLGTAGNRARRGSGRRDVDRFGQRVRPGIRGAIHAVPPIESAACRRQTA